MEHGKIISVLLRTKYQNLKASYIEKKVFRSENYKRFIFFVYKELYKLR